MYQNVNYFFISKIRFLILVYLICFICYVHGQSQDFHVKVKLTGDSDHVHVTPIGGSVQNTVTTNVPAYRITTEELKDPIRCKSVCSDAEIFPAQLENNTFKKDDIEKFKQHLRTIVLTPDNLETWMFACNNPDIAPCIKNSTALYIILGITSCGFVLVLGFLGFYIWRYVLK